MQDRALGAPTTNSQAGSAAEPAFSILLLEPNPDHALLISACLRTGLEHEVEITHAQTLPGARRCLKATRPVCALVGLPGPASDDLAPVRMLVGHDPLLPIIALVNGTAERSRGVEAVRAGAQDYLSKADLTPQIVGRMVRYAVERSRFQRRLRASEQVLARAMQHSPIGWCLLSPEGIFLEVNPAYAALLGRSADELIGTHFNQHTHPDDRAIGETALRELLAGTRSEFQTQKRYLGAGGRVVRSQVTVTAVRDEWGQRVERLLVQAHDITAQSEVDESRSQLAALVEGSNDAIYSKDLNGTITSWNRGAERFFGYARDEAVGTAARRLYPPELGDELREHLDRARHGQGSGPHETLRRRKDGSLVHASVVLSPIVDHRGQPVGISSIVRDITEQVRVRGELERSQERYRRLIEAVHEGIWVFEADGQTSLVNPRMAELLGSSPEELRGRSVWEFVEPPDAGLEADSAGERPREVRLRRHDGELVWALLSVARLHDSDGASRGSIVSVSDITSSKRSEVMFRTLLEQAPDAMVIIDRRGRIVLVNTQTERLFGYRRDQLVGQPVEVLLPAGCRERHVGHRSRYFEQADTHGPTRIDRLHGRRRDGSEFPAEILLSLLETDTERLVASSIRDISDRLEQERELEERERRFRAVFDHAEDAMLIMDDERRYRHVNPAAARLLGRSVEELLGLRADDLAAEQAGASADQTFARFKQVGQIRGEYVLRRPDGEERHVEYSAAAGILPGRHLTVLHDVTERVRSERERAELEAQLQQTQRLESIGKLAGGVAHDFNNLLSIILNYAHYAQAKAQDAELREELSEVIHAADRAASLTRQLLIFSRRELARPEVVDLGPAVGRAVGLIRRMLGERITIETELPERPMPIALDPAQLDQVLLNLAVNARDAMPAGGVLRFRLEPVATGESDTAPAAPGGGEGRVRLSVSDTGEGMEEEVLAHAFDPFFSTKPRGAGTGLGLATVYGIVNQAGGEISLRSRPGAGTTVEITWPRASGEPDLHEPPDDLRTPVIGGRTALVVEDEPSLRKLIERILSEHGYRVIAAAGAEEALAAAEAREVDLLVTDVVMTGIQGPQLAEILQAERPGLPTLFVSGYSDQAAVLAEHGHVLTKPFTAGQLLDSVAQALAAPVGQVGGG